MSINFRPISLAVLGFISIAICTGSKLSAQPFVDPCFTTGTIGTSFPANANISNNNADLMNWTGAAWTGAWPGANVVLAPPGSVPGTRAIWSGDGSVWTTGGEGFGLRLTTPIVTGTTYTFSLRRVSHGTGQNGNFRPTLYTNTGGSFGTSYGLIVGVGTAWANPNITFTALAASSGHTFVYFHNSVGSGMFMGCLVPILPMAFSELQAFHSLAAIDLTWHIQNEENYAIHEIERSLDGLTFEKIGEVPSVQASGEGHNYQFEDPISGLAHSQILYYRIVSLDLEGKRALSPVVDVQIGTELSFDVHLFPNPVRRDGAVSATFFSKSNGLASYQILDLSGKRLQAGQWLLQEGRNVQTLQMDGFAAGIYLLEIATEFGRSRSLLRMQ